MTRFTAPSGGGSPHRARSLAQPDGLLAQRQAEADSPCRAFFAPRTDSIPKYLSDTAALRLEFAQVLGWPLVGEDEASRIFRLRVPTVGPPDLLGLLFVPRDGGSIRC